MPISARAATSIGGAMNCRPIFARHGIELNLGVLKDHSRSLLSHKRRPDLASSASALDSSLATWKSGCRRKGLTLLALLGNREAFPALPRCYAGRFGI
jgi:hypothetical protein